MAREIRLVIGNHHSKWGIQHIVQKLEADLFSKLDVKISLFPDNNALNIFIEEFSSPDYRKIIENCSGPKILILTEFLFGKRDKLKINKFPTFKFGLLIDLLNISKNPLKILNITYLYLREALRRQLFFTQSYFYWKSREDGLSKLLKTTSFDFFILLHPECLKNSDVTKKNLTFYPEINFPDVKFSLSGSEFITMGSKNAYRLFMLNEIRKSLPIGITHLTMENLDITVSKNLANYVDVYLPNSPYWPFTSPIRITTSLGKGIPVVLYKNLDSHPICNTLPNIDQISELSKFESRDLDSLFRQNSKIYNDFALRENNKIIEAIQELL